MTELSDEARRALENETNRGPWDNFDPYYVDDEYNDDFFDWENEERDYDSEDDFEDYEIITWDEYLASLPWLERQWTRFTAWIPIVRLSNWWYRLSTRLHLTRRHNRF